MAFTVSSPLQEEEERRRRVQAELDRKMQNATGMGIDALGKMQALIAADEARKYERGHDALKRSDLLAQQGIENTRADADITLRTRADARAAALAKQNADAATATADTNALKGARDTLRAHVAAGLARGDRAVGIAKDAHNVPALGPITGDEEIEAEVARQEAEKAGGQVALDKPQLDRDNAIKLQELRNKGKKGKGGDKPQDFFAIDEVDARVHRKAKVEVMKAQKASTALRGIIKQYNLEEYVGPVDGRVEWLKSKFGLQDADAARINSTIRRAFDAYRHAITGAAASIPELSSFAQTVPTTFDSTAQIIGKLYAGDDIVNNEMQSLNQILGSGTTRDTADTADTVVVTNGAKTFRIKRSRLAEAEADNFRVVP